MLSERPQKTKSWRDHWLVKNVLAEIPILGSYFSKKSVTEAVHDAGKCFAALCGGTAFMMNILTPSKSDSMATSMVKMTCSMCGGMMAGKVIYNGLCSGGVILFQYLSKKKPIDDTEEVEEADIALMMASASLGSSQASIRPRSQQPL